MNAGHGSIRWKLTQIILATCGAALVVSGVTFAAYDVYFSRQTRLQTLTTLAQITAANSSAAVSFGDSKSAADILTSLRSENEIMHAAVYTANGKVLAAYRRDDAGVPFKPPPAASDHARFDGNRIVVFQSIQVDGHAGGTIYLESDVSAITNREKGLAAMLGTALLASLLVALVVGPKLQKPITEPILELARTAFAISVNKNYAIRAASNATDEIGYLYKQFNQMLEQIQQRDAELEKIRADLESRVAERTALLSALIEGSPLAIVITDVDGTARSINPAFSRLFGYSSEEMTGANLDDRVAPPELMAEAKALTRGRPEGGVVQLETRRRRKDGTLVDVEIHSVPLRVHGNPVASFAMYEDISHRKRAEEALRDANAKLNAIIQASPLGIVTTDLTGRIHLCNPAFAQLFQFSAEEAVGAKLNDLIVPEEFRTEAEELTQRGRAGEITHAATRRKRKDGALLDVELYGVGLRIGDAPVGGLVLYQDISRRRRAEEELKRAKEAAEAANRAKSDFLANMSHEIRTPMNGVIGMTELALETELTPEQREYLDMVKASADALLRVINDILDFSRVEAGKLELEREPFALRASIGETMKLLGHLAHRKKLELAWQTSAAVPEWVVGDCGRLRQMVVNLVGNAIKFTERGEVVLSIAVESVAKERVELHFRISDTGIGIPADKQELIFGAFTQADGSTTRKYGGTGLGLAIVQRLAGLQGGKLWVESDTGMGSVFHFTVQLGLPDERFVAPSEPDPDSLRGLRVLVVDDNRTNRLILVELLKQWSMLPEEAETGKKALELLHRAAQDGRPFRIAILDAQMPEMDGFMLARRIKGETRFSATSTIMLSSGVRSGEASIAREVRISAYLTKPAKPSELLDAILNSVTNGGKTSPSLVPSASLEFPRSSASGLRILLAEDNAVNRQLAARLLEKRGHSVVAVNDGRQALEAVEREKFHLVLMDVQMPEVDGLEATRMIRKKERSTGRHLPVIAVTAHVMKGDREKCFEAGSDDYVSKPIQADELYAAIDRLQHSPGNYGSPPTEAKVAPAARDLDADELLAHVQGDRELLADIIRLFRVESASLLHALREAVENNDATVIRRASHTLKGSLGYFGSGPACQTAKQMEEIARNGDAHAARRILPQLEIEIGRLLVALEPFGRAEVK